MTFLTRLFCLSLLVSEYCRKKVNRVMIFTAKGWNPEITHFHATQRSESLKLRAVINMGT